MAWLGIATSMTCEGSPNLGSFTPGVSTGALTGKSKSPVFTHFTTWGDGSSMWLLARPFSLSNPYPECGFRSISGRCRAVKSFISRKTLFQFCFSSGKLKFRILCACHFTRGRYRHIPVFEGRGKGRAGVLRPLSHPAQDQRCNVFQIAAKCGNRRAVIAAAVPECMIGNC